MGNLAGRLRKELGYFKHDISALWSCHDLSHFIFFALLTSPAWILGFILSAVGWYDFLKDDF